MDTCIMWRMWLLDSLVKFKAMLIISGVIAGVAGGVWLGVREDNKSHPDEAKWLKWSLRLLMYCPVGIVVGVLMPTGEALTGYRNRVQEYRERRQRAADLARREEVLRIEMKKLEKARLLLLQKPDTQKQQPKEDNKEKSHELSD